MAPPKQKRPDHEKAYDQVFVLMLPPLISNILYLLYLQLSNRINGLREKV
jgi:hypothetical protein